MAPIFMILHFSVVFFRDFFLLLQYCLCAVGLPTLGWIVFPIRVWSWFLLFIGTSSSGRSRCYVDGRVRHRKMIARGFTIYRRSYFGGLLFMSSVPVAYGNPSSIDRVEASYFRIVFDRIRLFESYFSVPFLCLSRIRSNISTSGPAFAFVSFTMLVACIFLVAGSISGRLWYLQLKNFVRCHFYGDSVRGKSTAPTIIVSVPTRFRMRGRYRSHFYQSKNR